MRFSSRLRRRLSALRGAQAVPGRAELQTSSRRAASTDDPSLQDRPVPGRARTPLFDETLLETLEMESVQTCCGRVEVRRLRLPHLMRPASLEPYTSGAGGRRVCAFFDTETLGLGSQPIFLGGVAWLEAKAVAIEQIFARDYSREAALLARLGDLWRSIDLLITFNGRAYDIPLVRDRVVRHRQTPLDPVGEIDLLPLARRRWGRELPDCRLSTLEHHVLGRSRFGDVPGAEIPPLYHRAVRTGDLRLLAPVFYHNALDLLSMIELLPRLVMPGEGSQPGV